MRISKGFTLIELLLYIGVSALVLLALSALFFTLLNARTKNESIAEVETQGAAAMAMMTQIIRNAETVTLPIDGESGPSLTLVVDDAALSPTVFSVEDGVLMMTEGADDPTPLTNSRVEVTGFTAENLTGTGTPGSIHITLSLSRFSPSERNEYDYEKTFVGSASLKP